MSDAKHTPEQCSWHQDEEGFWNSECGACFVLNEGIPSENDMNFCHKCGNELVEHKWSEHEESC